MSVLTALYTLLLRPLELIFEVIYVLANRIIQNPGMSIIALSLAMNFLVLPLYRRADAMQEEERNTEQKLNKWVTHIKRTFSGDKRYMITQEYYRQNNYKPSYALKGSLSLLLEIPFFIAAYRFLSGLELLQGVSFGPIHDLGVADGLIVIGGLHINLLPILMTLINIVSGAIYTKGMPLKSKLQLYAMALVFLVFLYTSPAGLVFYWTLNNIFSLVKNVFYKLKNPRRVLGCLASAAGIALIVFFGAFYAKSMLKRRLVFIAFGLVLQLPLIFDLCAGRLKGITGKIPKESDNTLFYISALLNTILVGVLIPSAVIESSPAEFVDVTQFASPLGYLWYSGLLAFGTFFLWVGLFYYLTSKSGRNIFSKIYFALSCTFLINYMVYGKGQSNLSDALQYEATPKFAQNQQLINILIVVAVIAVIYLMATRLPKVAKLLCVSAMLAVLVMSAWNIRNVSHKLNSDLSYIKEQAQTVQDIQENGLIHLDKNGKNVVVIMLDRAMGSYTPYIFNEKPELKEKFDGFTCYHNTTAFGPITVYGAPALMGGYEYTPEAINDRSDETFLDKYNQSSRLMPYMFDDNGFEVTVCDPPLAGLEYVPDLSIYDEHPDIKTYMINKRLNLVGNDQSQTTENIRKRNFFCFGITKIMPLFLQGTLYNNGLYNDANAGTGVSSMTVQVQNSVSKSVGMERMFMNTYSVMNSLSNLTRVDDAGKNNFFFMCNEMTHEVMMLQEPDYVPSETVDNTPYDKDIETRYDIDGIHMIVDSGVKAAHYDCNMSAMIQLSNWFDYLRAEDVYDNTRIIIVSDHGTSGGQFKQLLIDDTFDAQEVTALLMVKDFNATGFEISDEFMTNADTPSLAMQGIIDNPTNPFTGKAINSDEKLAHDQLVLHCKDAMPTFRDGNTYPDGEWYAVHSDIWEKDNWSHVKN